MTHDENYKLTTSNYSKAPNPILSHEELLAKIDGYIEHDCDCWQCNMAKALRAVVELHNPTPEKVFVSEIECIQCDSDYPCPTIQAIEKELE